MCKFEELFKSLSVLLQEYEERFIKPYMPTDPSVGPSIYELDVKAYCLLSHAAFEDFFESVALNLMSLSIKKWISSKDVTDTLLMLLCSYGLKLEISSEDKAEEVTVYDRIRLLSEEVKRRFSNDIHGNHGISPKYLRSLLVPIAIDFNLEANASNSLQKLSQERGEYAHKGFVKRSLAPEDAFKHVQDCLALAENVKNKTIAKKWIDPSD